MQSKTKNKTATKTKINKKSQFTKKYHGVSPKFMKWLEEFTSEHDDVLRELAKRCRGRFFSCHQHF